LTWTTRRTRHTRGYHVEMWVCRLLRWTRHTHRLTTHDGHGVARHVLREELARGLLRVDVVQHQEPRQRALSRRLVQGCALLLL
jgi:hypothetical protein